MFGISGVEFVVIMVAVLLVFGPKELPATMRTVGRMMRGINGMSTDMRRQFETALRQAEREIEADELKKSIRTAMEQPGPIATPAAKTTLTNETSVSAPAAADGSETRL
jgi:sec-independent protein translocase protein TatB